MQAPSHVEAVPDEEDELDTKGVFRQCVGKVFRVRGIGTNSAHGETNHVELWGLRGTNGNDELKAETIWVEQEYVEIVANGAAAHAV